MAYNQILQTTETMDSEKARLRTGNLEGLSCLSDHPVSPKYVKGTEIKQSVVSFWLKLQNNASLPFKITCNYGHI